jgi:hypothetical protein
MTIKDQLKQLRDAFAPWAQANGGSVAIASDEYHLVFLLTQSPGKPRTVLLCQSETKRGEYEEAGQVDRTFNVFLSQGKGLKLDPGASLTEGTAGGHPTYDLVEEARELIRAISFDSETTEVTPNYKGWSPYPIDGYLTDTIKLEFSIGTQLPAVDLEANPAHPDSETE